MVSFKNTKFTRTKQLIHVRLGFLFILVQLAYQNKFSVPNLFSIILIKYDGKLLNATNNSDDIS